jgi:hypothetical protein
MIDGSEVGRSAVGYLLDYGWVMRNTSSASSS